jgi:hypothetical protein
MVNYLCSLLTQITVICTLYKEEEKGKGKEAEEQPIILCIKAPLPHHLI